LQRFFSELEDLQEGKGVSLLQEVEKAASLLIHFPLMAPQWSHTVRRLMIRRRNLALFYVPEPRGIVVIGMADLRSDPDQIWREIRSRLP
jgi:hypothetical protein